MELSPIILSADQPIGVIDSDLALFLGIETRAINQAAKRSIHVSGGHNLWYQMSREQFRNLYPQNKKWGGKRYLPFVYSFEGVCLVINRLRLNLTRNQKNIILSTFQRNDIPLIDYGDFRFEESIIHRLKKIFNSISSIKKHYPVNTLLGRFYVDVYLLEANIAIEIDEENHRWRKDLDLARQSAIEETLRCKILRIKKNDDFDILINNILRELLKNHDV